ncbi:MAG: YIP1 family protein [Haloferacaceae archaeon]
MTTWIEEPHGGRDRGPRALVRAWVEVLVRPRRFFRNGVAPGDQAPGLTFAVAVALAVLLERLALDPGSLPRLGAGPVLSAVLLVLLVGLVLAPAALHLTAAVQTLVLMAVVPERGGISQTVQVVAYASAPCALAGIPVPGLRLVCAAYGAVLLAVGLAAVHDASLPRAAVAGAVPAAALFGYGFGGFAAGEAVLTALGLLG